MGTGSITQYIDVAQLVLYAFWIFFFGLVFYLAREGHREGYPMEDASGNANAMGWPIPGTPKIYKLADGSERMVPRQEVSRQRLMGQPSHGWAGAPLDPINANPMLDGIGPGAWADRADVPDLTSHGHPRIQPLRASGEFGVSSKNVDPRGLPVVGADGAVGGTVSDLWIDHSEHLFRYLEVRLADGSRSVLVPMNFARVKTDVVQVRSILGHQFAQVPGIRRDTQVTFLEEEKIMAYYGAGTLYAEPSRLEPLV